MEAAPADAPVWSLRSGALVKHVYDDGTATCFDVTLDEDEEHELYEHGTSRQQQACDALGRSSAAPVL